MSSVMLVPLSTHIATIDRGLSVLRQTTIEIGTALIAIHDNWDSYMTEAGCDSFEEFCTTRWGWKRARPFQLMQGARVVENIASESNLSTRVDNVDEVQESSPLPSSEYQARPLRVLDTPKEQKAAWYETVKRHGPTPTHDQVKAVVEEVIEEQRVVQEAFDNAPAVDKDRYERARLVAAFSRGVVATRGLISLKPDYLIGVLDDAHRARRGVRVRNDDGTPSKVYQHTLWDEMTWSEYIIQLEELEAQHNVLETRVLGFRKLLRLRDLHPTLTVGNAMRAEGLDPQSYIFDAQ